MGRWTRSLSSTWRARIGLRPRPVVAVIVPPDEDTADVPVSEPVVVAADVIPATSRPLAGVLRLVLAMHADGLTKPGVDVSAWIAEAQQHAQALAGRGIPASWEFTGSEVEALERAIPGWLATLRAYGITVAGREPHAGDGTAADSMAALDRAGVAPAGYLGSCLDAGDYATGPYPIVTGQGSLGHTADADWSGVRRLSPSVVLVGSGTADSVAIKRGIARDVFRGARAWAIEVVRYNGLQPGDGAEPWFSSPARHDGAQAPVPIIEDIDRMLGDVASDGASGAVMWTSYPEAVAAWQAGGEPGEYVVAKS